MKIKEKYSRKKKKKNIFFYWRVKNKKIRQFVRFVNNFYILALWN